MAWARNVYQFSRAGRGVRPVPRWGGVPRRGIGRRGSGRFGASLLATAIGAAIVAVAAGLLHLWENGLGGAGSVVQPHHEKVERAGDTLRAAFSLCAGATRVNCVVDGDTFWFRGEKIRVADIDTPELSPPRCAREAQLGEAAKHRLLTLLNAGPFSLAAAPRHTDRYGRELRTVSRDGRSLGEILAAEGLARRWEGFRRGWCD